jgi:RHS repeat-associated protein
VGKAGGSTSLQFVYDESGHLIGEYDESDLSGTPVEETVYLGDTPVAVLKNNGVYYIQTDQLGAPRAVADTTNKVVWRWDSDPFGAAPANEDPDGDGVTFAYNLRFPGQYYDAETGLHYNYLRDYDPSIGRYIQSDPIGLAGGINTYTYVNGNPLSKIDPLGLDAIIAHGGTLTYYNNNGAIVGTYSYTTGRPGVTDTTISGQGPIPLGTYTADPQQISEGGFFRNLLGDWGNYRVPRIQV